MDFTLREYADKMDEIQNTLNQVNIIKGKDCLLELEGMIKQIQSIAIKGAQIYNNYKLRFRNIDSILRDDDENDTFISSSNDYVHMLRETKTDYSASSISPSSSPSVSRRSSASGSDLESSGRRGRSASFSKGSRYKRSISPEKDYYQRRDISPDRSSFYDRDAIPDRNVSQLEKKFGTPLKNIYKQIELAPGIDINVQTVANIDLVPNTNIYWVENIKQFVIKINNVVLRGNIGNIYKKTDPSAKDCKRGKDCKYIGNKKKCGFYHDPLLILDKVKINKPVIKNFTGGSWLYTHEPKNKKNKNMRHIGTRNTLLSDLEILQLDSGKDREVKLFMDQTMHDILVSLAIDKCGLISENPRVPIVSTKYRGKSELLLI